MEGKPAFALLLFGAAFLMGKPSQKNEVPSCIVKPGSKIDCGWLGIDKGTCLKRNCCWDDTNPEEYFCYKKGTHKFPIRPLPGSSFGAPGMWLLWDNKEGMSE